MLRHKCSLPTSLLPSSILLLLLLLLPPPLPAILLPPHGQASLRLPLPPRPDNLTVAALTVTAARTSGTGGLIFSAFHQGSLNTWGLEEGGRQVRKALCLDPGQGQGEESVTVTVFSTSGREQGVEVEAGWYEGGLGLGEEGQREVQLSAGSTQVGHHCTQCKEQGRLSIGDLSRNYASFAKLVSFKTSFCIQGRLFENLYGTLKK